MTIRYLSQSQLQALPLTTHDIVAGIEHLLLEKAGNGLGMRRRLSLRRRMDAT